MATPAQPFTIEFPEGYDAQAEFEAPYRGYLPDVTVHLEDGTRHQLTFMDQEFHGVSSVATAVSWSRW